MRVGACLCPKNIKIAFFGSCVNVVALICDKTKRISEIMEASIVDIQNEVSSLGKRVAELEEHNDVENIKGELRDVRVELNNVRDRLDSLGVRVSETQVQMAELKTEMTDRMSKLETNIAKLETNLTSQMSELKSEMTDRMSKLESNVTELRSEFKSDIKTQMIATITVLGGLIVILQFFA